MQGCTTASTRTSCASKTACGTVLPYYSSPGKHRPRHVHTTGLAQPAASSSPLFWVFSSLTQGKKRFGPRVAITLAGPIWQVAPRAGAAGEGGRWTQAHRGGGPGPNPGRKGLDLAPTQPRRGTGTRPNPARPVVWAVGGGGGGVPTRCV